MVNTIQDSILILLLCSMSKSFNNYLAKREVKIMKRAAVFAVKELRKFKISFNFIVLTFTTQIALNHGLESKSSVLFVKQKLKILDDIIRNIIFYST